jgi:hypothetical protein
VGLGARHVSVLINRARKSFAEMWVQVHISDLGENAGEHGWCLAHVGRVMTGQASAQMRARLRRHLSCCGTCRQVVTGVGEIWRPGSE